MRTTFVALCMYLCINRLVIVTSDRSSSELWSTGELYFDFFFVSIGPERLVGWVATKNFLDLNSVMFNNATVWIEQTSSY
jgi:hypothetical protein